MLNIIRINILLLILFLINIEGRYSIYIEEEKAVKRCVKR